MHFSGEINIGNVISAVAVIATLLTLHKQNVSTLISAARSLAEISVKVDTMWKIFEQRRDMRNKFNGGYDQ